MMDGLHGTLKAREVQGSIYNPKGGRRGMDKSRQIYAGKKRKMVG